VHNAPHFVLYVTFHDPRNPTKKRHVRAMRLHTSLAFSALHRGRKRREERAGIPGDSGRVGEREREKEREWEREREREREKERERRLGVEYDLRAALCRLKVPRQFDSE